MRERILQEVSYVNLKVGEEETAQARGKATWSRLLVLTARRPVV